MRIAVVGAGWAGLAAAIELLAAGHQPVILEAAPACGGRARGIASGWQGRFATAATASLDAAGTSLAFDNGQHLVIGAYSSLLALLARVGVSESEVFERLPFRLDDGAGLVIPGPGLAGLLRAKGLSWPLRMTLVRVLTGIVIARERALAAARGKSVATWSRDSGHPPALLATLWQPLVISTMNTPTDQACAETFVRVLADSLAGGRGASDFLIPHGTLSTAFVDPALAWLRGRGVLVRNGCDIRAITRDEGGYRLITSRDRVGDGAGAGSTAGATGTATATAAAAAAATVTAAASDDSLSGFDGIVLATPPANAARILRGRGAEAGIGRTGSRQAGPGPTGDRAAKELSSLLLALEAFDYRPITTVNLGWRDRSNGRDATAADVEVAAADSPADRWQRLPVATLLHDDPQRFRFGQWLFRRPDRAGWRIGAVVISDSAAAIERSREALARDASRQLSDALALPPADVYAVFHEKRATIAAVHDRPRLAAEVPGHPGIVLAGDYRYHAYPATLEAALRSGRDAVAALDRMLRHHAASASGH